MVKLLIVFILLTTALFSKEEASCYTVQLVSALADEESRNTLESQAYPKTCKLMQISRTLTVRCGCYEKVSQAQKELSEFKKLYKYAYVASTYKYRFSDKQRVVVVSKKSVQKAPESQSEGFITKDEELKLMLQSFLYVNDLENAYKTAKIAYKRNPKSYYWNQKMAEICRWTSRGEEAIKYMKFMYSQKYDVKLRDDIVNYGLGSYQYEEIEPLVVTKAIENPSNENIERMIFIHSEVGYPERSVEILLKEYEKYPKNKIYLTKALQISLEMGDLDSAKNIIKTIEKTPPYTSKDAELISAYYYLGRDIPSAYEALLNVNEKDVTQKYYELLSDLGWYLQKYENASKASTKLYEMKKARLVDYERIAQMQKEDNLSLVGDVGLLAYKEYKVSYIFYVYANSALKAKEYDNLNKKINRLATINKDIEKESNYWIIKAQLYSHYNQTDLVVDALERALVINPNSMQIQLSILYFYLDNGLDDALKLGLDALSENKNLSTNYYFPLASSYFYLQDVNRAAYYVDKIHEEELVITQSLDFKFLEAYIYQIRNNSNAFILKMREIDKDLEKLLEIEPTLSQENIYLNNYLSVGINIWDTDKFEQELKSAKPYLSQKNYENLHYSLAIKKNAYGLSNEIYKAVNKKELWMRFSNAILSQNHSELENLLDAYLKILPLGEASSVAYTDGQTALAQTLAFDALSHNDDSQNAYIQHLALSKERTDLFSIKPSYYSRKPLLQEYISVKNRTYLGRDYYLNSGFNYYKNKTIDENVLLSVPDDILQASLGIKKIFRRGFLEFNAQYNDSMQSYLSYELSGEYRFSHYFNAGLSIADNIKAEESTQLLLGGKKDTLELKLLWNLLPSTSFEYLYSHNEYSSQDDVNLGSGEYARVSLSYQIRNGYPDMKLGTFVDMGIYSETEGSRGVIDILLGPDQLALPENFYNLGFNFAYGMANSEIYTRVWRPYFEASSYYNSFSKDMSYGLNFGYGGKLNGQDHLVFGSSYTESVNGVGGSIFELFMRYKFLYVSP